MSRIANEVTLVTFVHKFHFSNKSLHMKWACFAIGYLIRSAKKLFLARDFWSLTECLYTVLLLLLLLRYCCCRTSAEHERSERQRHHRFCQLLARSVWCAPDEMLMFAPHQRVSGHCHDVQGTETVGCSVYLIESRQLYDYVLKLLMTVGERCVATPVA